MLGSDQAWLRPGLAQTRLGSDLAWWERTLSAIRPRASLRTNLTHPCIHPAFDIEELGKTVQRFPS
jgi:hypothetical protein